MYPERIDLKKRLLLYILQIYQKTKKFPYVDKLGDNDQKDAYLSNKLQLRNRSLTFDHKNKSLLSATSIRSRSPMAYNTTASLDKLTCTVHVDFGKSQEKFGWFFWSKNDSNYLDVKLKIFMKDDNKQFQLVPNHTIVEADFNQLMRLSAFLVLAAEHFAREKNFSPVLISTLS